jgi:hypothetical protein
VFYYIQFIALISLFGFALINMVTIYREYSAFAELRSTEPELSPGEPVYRFSKTGKNVLIIMLDRAIGGYVPYILREKPSLVSALAGFTWYPNSVSFGGWTLFGAPPLFGGYEYTPLEMQKRDSEPLVKKHNESLLVLPRLFSEIGYKVTVTNPPWANYRFSSDLSIFDEYPEIFAKNSIGAYSTGWLKKNPGVQSQSVAGSLQNNLIRYSIFKCASPVLRELLYDNGEWLTLIDSGRLRGSLPKSMLDNYISLDILPEITLIEKDSANTFTVLVNDITHEPGFLEEPDYTVPVLREQLSAPKKHLRPKHYHVNMAAFLLLAKWFDFLKEKGVYENTRIIIASDHGGNLHSYYRNNIILPNG